MDISSKLKKSIAMYGTDVLYSRSSKHIRCNCYNPLHRTGDSKCNVCLGTGYVSSIEYRKIIYDSNIIKEEAMNKGYGIQRQDDVVFYGVSNLKPAVGDIISIPKLKDGIIICIEKTFIISSVNELRMRDGKVEGYMIFTKIKPDLLAMMNNFTKSLTVTTMNLLNKGGRYICPYKKV